MFLFSKRGGVLLIALGFLLSLIGSSHTIMCYNCFGVRCENPEERKCEEGVKFCVRRRLKDPDDRWTQGAECAHESHATTLGCTQNKGPEYDEGSETCLCDTDLCNTKDILSSDGIGGGNGGNGGGAGGEGGAKTGASMAVFTTSHFGILGGPFRSTGSPLNLTAFLEKRSRICIF